MIRAVGLFDTTCVSLKIFITPIRPPPAVEVSAVLNAIISPTTNGLILFDVILDAEIAFDIDSAVALSKSNPESVLPSKAVRILTLISIVDVHN